MSIFLDRAKWKLIGAIGFESTTYDIQNCARTCQKYSRLA